MTYTKCDSICRTLETFHGGRMVEIRGLGIPPRDGVASGYFYDYYKAAVAARKLEERKAAGVYFILNEIHPACHDRSPERLTDSPKHTTSNQDVLRRRWLLIDVDPIRPAGVSSDNDQLAEAISVRNDILAWEREGGNGRIVTALSGNGAHLLLEIDDPPEDQIKRYIETLSMFTHGTGCKVDTAVSKMAQLTKLYGTMTRKGYSSKDRPHRRSRLEEIYSANVPEFVR